MSPQQYLKAFDETGVSIAGLNCNGNPLHADPEVGPGDAEDLRNAIKVAGLLGVDRVVTMSGLPPAHAGGQWPAWHVNTWDTGYLDCLDYQWDEVAVPFWMEIDALARRTASRSRSRCTRRTWCSTRRHSSASWRRRCHQRRRRDGPVAPVLAGHRPGRGDRLARPLVFHAAAKDTRINENCKIYGVLDERFTRIPLDQNPTGLGGRHVVNKWPRTRRGTSSRSARPRRRVLGPLPASLERSIPTWRSTSNTRTSNWVSSKAASRRRNPQSRQFRPRQLIM